MLNLLLMLGSRFTLGSRFMIFHELLVVACIATAPDHCENVIINASPPWMDRQSCEAVGKRMTEKLGGSYECTPYRSTTSAM
jgi:hypothetical protein